MKLTNVVRQRLTQPLSAASNTSRHAHMYSPHATYEVPQTQVDIRTGGSARANTLLVEELKAAKDICTLSGPSTRHIPYLGSYFRYKKPFGKYNPHTFTHSVFDNYRKYGKIYKDRFLGVDSVNILDPEGVRIIYQYEGKMPIIMPIMNTIKYHRKLRNLSPGLGNTNGEEWYHLRRAVQDPMMKPKSGFYYLQGSNQVAEDFVNHVIEKKRDPVTGAMQNIENELTRWTLESMTMLVLQKRLGAFTSKAPETDFIQRMIDHNHSFFEDSLQLQFSLPINNVLSTPAWNRALKSYDYFFHESQRLIDEALFKMKSAIDSVNLKEGNYVFLRKLLNQKNFSYKDLSMICTSLLVDSLKTTGSSISSQLFMLASNPDKQQLAYEEIKRVCPDSRAPITQAQIDDMTYLKACVKESHRLMPNAIDISRIVQQDLVICGYRIPKGTMVNLYHPLLLNDPQYVDNPNQYLPERWVAGANNKMHPFLHLPFGFGLRSCPGRRIAEMDMTVLIVKLLQRYRLTTPQTRIPDFKYLFLQTYDPIAISMETRK